jgi:hypothetical protein
MPIELRNMETEPPVGKLKIALIGAEKNGKSRLAATGRKPVLFHDFDNRAEVLQGIPGVFVISYVDPQWPRQPTAAQDFLSILSKIENSLDLLELGFNVPKGTFIKTNVIDSTTTFAKCIERYSLYNTKDIRRTITFAGHEIHLKGGWDAVNVEMSEVENNILRFLALPTDTIVTLHETPEEAHDSTEKNPKYTGRIGVYPPRYRMLIKYFNEVWRVKLAQVVSPDGRLAYLPRVTPLPNYELDCASALLLDQTEEPNISEMIKKHESRLNDPKFNSKLLSSQQAKQLVGVSK